MDSALIVGLGKIGMGYDLDLPPDRFVLSHARALSQNPNFHLVGGVDPDESKRTLFSQNYLKPSFSSLSEALREVRPSVIVLSSPTRSHALQVRECLEADPKIILCEKPLSYNLIEAKEIVRQAQKANTPLYVNYIRRYDSAVIRVKDFIQADLFETPFLGFGEYGKGLIHNGTHMLDLLGYWFGFDPKVENVGRSPRKPDPDGCPSAILRYSTGLIHLKSAGEDSESFTLRIEFKNGTLAYKDSGKVVTWTQARGVTGNVLENRGETNLMTLESSMDFYQLKVSEGIYAALKGDKSRLCSGDQALKSLELAVAILEASHIND